MTAAPPAGLRDLHRLIEAVQRNCDIADARHARDATLCIYLLQMRERFAWEHELPLSAQPARDELARWLAEREAAWNDLEERPYEDLAVNGLRVPPFETQVLNEVLLPQGLVYGAGYGRFHRPHFFLATLEHREVRDGIDVQICGCEYARDLAAPPATLRGATIQVRREALRRWLWEKIEFWRNRRTEGALARAIQAWGVEHVDGAAFERLVAAETETLILHELGEARAAGLLGEHWEEMLARTTERRAELLARAVRDNLADCLSTLPALLGREDAASLHFFFSQFEGLRRELFPALTGAYRDWRESGTARALQETIERGTAHWTRVARQLLASAAAQGNGDPRAFAL